MAEEEKKQELQKKYGKSEKENFRVIDTIPVPHPYCITPRHVAHAARRFAGILSAGAVEDAEKHGARCDTCKGRLKFKEHEIALLVECRTEIKGEDGQVDPELHAYLKSIVDMAEQDHYAGFAFMRAKE